MSTISSPLIRQVEYEEPTSDVPTRHRMTALAGAAADTILDREAQRQAEDDEQDRPERPPGLWLGVLGLYLLYRLLR